MWRVGGIGVGIGVGWNIAVLGPIATRLSHVYGVSLAVIGAFVTVQFVMHMVMQSPGGRAADRWGARSSALLGMGLVVIGNAISLPRAAAARGRGCASAYAHARSPRGRGPPPPVPSAARSSGSARASPSSAAAPTF